MTADLSAHRPHTPAEQQPTHTPTHSQWAAEALWQQLQTLLPGLSVEVQARCPSTNSVLLERARLAGGDPQRGDAAAETAAGAGARAQVQRGRRAADAAPALLVAEHQTEGRGRQGRTWQAAPGMSLTFSLALPYAPRQWEGLSLAVGLALAEALEPLPGTANPGPGAAAPPAAPTLQLKWPNDLWLCMPGAPGRKLGGVLIETVSLGSGAASTGQRMVVVGVGLNVAPRARPADALPQGLSSGYACVQELLPGTDAPAVLHRVAAPLVRALLAFQHQGFAPLAEAYARRDLLRGQPVSTTLAELSQGVAEGVDADGALRVRTAHGVQRVSSGEVSIRLQPPAGLSHAANPPDPTPGDRPC